MPAKRALSVITAGPAEDCIMLSDHEHINHNRVIRALPKHRPTNAKFMRYRSGTHHMLTDDDEEENHDFDTTDTELGTALSDVEGEVQLQLWSRGSTPQGHVGSDDQEGEMVDDALYTAASSPAPGAESDRWMGDGKGKAVDPRETGQGGWVDMKRRWNERDEQTSDCDADDEDQVAEVVLKKRRKHTVSEHDNERLAGFRGLASLVRSSFCASAHRSRPIFASPSPTLARPNQSSRSHRG
jgi:hypothetical protein